MNDTTPFITYLIYIVVYETLVLGGCAYVVFWKGASPWWFVLAVMLSNAAYKPSHWIHGETPCTRSTSCSSPSSTSSSSV
jgi:hypothetical protein